MLVENARPASGALKTLAARHEPPPFGGVHNCYCVQPGAGGQRNASHQVVINADSFELASKQSKVHSQPPVDALRNVLLRHAVTHADETPVAVGMPVTRHPLHRSVRALLTHTAPILSVYRQIVCLAKDAQLWVVAARLARTD